VSRPRRSSPVPLPRPRDLPAHPAARLGGEGLLPRERNLSPPLHAPQELIAMTPRTLTGTTACSSASTTTCTRRTRHRVGQGTDPRAPARRSAARAARLIQCDWQGARGWTRLGPRRWAPLRPAVVQRRAAHPPRHHARAGIKLGMHYSGVWDSRAIELHPDWACIGPDGAPNPNMTCRLSDYDDKLMIPQMLSWWTSTTWTASGWTARTGRPSLLVRALPAGVPPPHNAGASPHPARGAPLGRVLASTGTCSWSTSRTTPTPFTPASPTA